MARLPLAHHQVPAAPPDEPTPSLLVAVRAGDSDALGTLYALHAVRLLNVAQRITKHTEDAEDVVHDVFVGLPTALKHYEHRGRFSGWLVTCTVRTALMRRRTRARQQEVTMEDAWPADASPTANSRPDLAPELAEAETRLAALPEALRTVLTLRSEGFGHAEIASALGISEGNSRIRLARALEQMLAPDCMISTIKGTSA